MPQPRLLKKKGREEEVAELSCSRESAPARPSRRKAIIPNARVLWSQSGAKSGVKVAMKDLLCWAGFVVFAGCCSSVCAESSSSSFCSSASFNSLKSSGRLSKRSMGAAENSAWQESQVKSCASPSLTSISRASPHTGQMISSLLGDWFELGVEGKIEMGVPFL